MAAGATLQTDPELPDGKDVAIAGYMVWWLYTNLPEILARAQLVGNDGNEATAGGNIEASGLYGAAGGDGVLILQLLAEWNTKISALSAANATKGYQGKVLP